MIGNKLRINKILYEKINDKLKTIPIPTNIAFLIKEDLYRTYPNLDLLEKDSVFYEELKHILELFHVIK